MANIVLSILGNDQTKEAFESAGKGAEGFQGKAKLAVTGIAAAASAAAIGMAATAVNGAMEAEKSQAKIAGSLGLTAEQSARFGKLAGEVYGQNYGDSLEQVQDAIANVGTGVSGMKDASNSAVSSMTKNVLSFSSAFDMDTSDAIQQVNQLITSKLAKDGPEALDLLTSAMQKVPKAVRGDLTAAVDEYAPFMSQLGLSGAQSMQLLVDSTGKGAFGLDKTGDALKEFTIRSTDMSKTSVSAYKSLGLNAHDMSNDILAGGDKSKSAFDKIVSGILAIKDPSERSNTAISLFGTQMEDLGTGNVPKFLKGLQGVGKGMEDTEGSATKLAATTGGGASNGIATFNRQWEMVTQSLVKDVLPIISQVFGFLSSNQDVLKILAIGLGVAAVAFTAVSVAMWLAAAAEAVALGPIILIVAGVGLLIAAIVLLITHWGDVVAFFRGVWANVAAWFQGTLKAIGTWWSDTWDGIVGFFRDVLNTAVQLFQRWTLVGIITSHWKEILTGAKTAWGNVTDFIGGIPAKVIGFFTGIGKWLLDAGGDLLDGLLDGAKKGLLAVGRWELGIGEKVIGWLAGAASWLVDTGSDILHGLAAGAKAGWSAVTSFLGGIPRKITGAIDGASRILFDIGGDVVDGLVNGLRGAWSGVTAAIHNLVGLIPLAVRKLLGINSPSKVFAEIGDFLGKGFQEGIDGSSDDVVKSMQTLSEKVIDAAKAKGGISAEESGVISYLKTETTAIKRIADDRDTIAGRIEKSNDRLKAAREAKEKLADDLSTSAMGGGNIATAFNTAAGAEGATQQSSVQGVLNNLKQQTSDATEFKNLLTTLKREGLDAASYSQLVDAGVSGGMQTARALVSGGPEIVAQMSSMQHDLANASGVLGRSTAQQMYDAGIQAEKGYRSGLVDKQADLTGQIGVIEAGIAGKVGTLGVNTGSTMRDAANAIVGAGADGIKGGKKGFASAVDDIQDVLEGHTEKLSKKQVKAMKSVGKDIVAGLRTGVNGSKGDLDDLFDDLSDGMVKRLKKALGIKSPSQVFRDQVGAMIPAGIVEGITAGVPDITRSVASMVAVPSYATAPGSTGRAGQYPTSSGSGGTLVHIDTFMATPEQSPADIAAGLGWLARGGL